MPYCPKLNPDPLQERFKVSPGFLVTGPDGMDSRLWPSTPKSKNYNGLSTLSYTVHPLIY